MSRYLPVLVFFLISASAHAQGDPVAGAKRAINIQFQARSLKEMANNYTNETAANGGLMLSALANMIVNQKGFARATSPRTETAQQKTKRLEAMAQFKQLNDALSSILRKYGAAGYNSNPFAALMATGGKSDGGSRLPIRLRANGRAMLNEVAETYVQIVPGSSDDMMQKMGRRNGMAPSAFDYKVLSPVRVAIVDKKQPARATEMEARFEDGRWRLHYDLLTRPHR